MFGWGESGDWQVLDHYHRHVSAYQGWGYLYVGSAATRVDATQWQRCQPRFRGMGWKSPSKQS